MKNIKDLLNEGKGLTLSIQLNSTDDMYGIFNAIHHYYHNLEGEQKAYKKDFENIWEALRKAAKAANIDLDPDYDDKLKKINFGY